MRSGLNRNRDAVMAEVRSKQKKLARGLSGPARLLFDRAVDNLLSPGRCLEEDAARIADARKITKDQALLKVLETPEGKQLYQAYCAARP